MSFDKETAIFRWNIKDISVIFAEKNEQNYTFLPYKVV